MAVTTAAARNSTDGYTTPNPEVYNAGVGDGDQMQRSDGPDPRHPAGTVGEVNNNPPAERVVPYTATGANPSYPQDALPGVGGLDIDVPIEAVQTPEPGFDDSEGITVVAPPEQTTVASLAAEGDGAIETPAGNASGEEWRAYAVSQGMSPEEADSMARDELRARYGG